MQVKYIAFEKEKIGEKDLAALARLLVALPPDAESRLLDFLFSPFFNKDKHLADLFKRLTQASGERLNASSLSKAWDKKLSAKNISDLVKQLYKQALNFAAHYELDVSEHVKNRVLLATLRNRGLPKEVQKLTEQYHKLLAKSALDLNVLVEDWLLDHFNYYSFDNDHEMAGTDKLQALQAKFQLLIQATTAMYGCESVHLSRSVAKQQPQSTVPQTSEVHFQLLTQLYTLHQEVLDSPASDLELHLKEFYLFFEKNQEKISRINAYILAKYTGYAVYKVAVQGYSSLLNAYFFWLKKATELAPRPIRVVPSKEFLNMVSLACYLEELTYAEQYIEAYAQYLPVDTAQMDNAVAQLYLLYARGHYSRVLDLVETDFKRYFEQHPSYLLRVKTIRLKAAMELELAGDDSLKYADELDKAEDDFRHFLKRQEHFLPQEAILRHLNFLNIVREIMKQHRTILGQVERQKVGQVLIDAIAQTKPIIIEEWLHEKTRQFFCV